MHAPTHIFFHNLEKPIVLNRRLPRANEQKQNCAHEKSGKKNTNGDKNAELGEAERTAEHERDETNRGGERAEKDGASEFRDRCCDSSAVGLAIDARLLVAAEDENRKVNAQSNQDRA